MSDKRLIDANALLVTVAHRNALDVLPGVDFERIWIYATVQNDMFKLVKKSPTIDAVEVVRCRECKYLIAPKLCSNPMACGWDALEPDDDDFCSRGEKKDGGAEG